MTMPDPHDAPGEVYATAFQTYWDHGWRGVLPVPPKSKKLTLKGYTGNQGKTPSYADVYTWADEFPHANIALRLPETVIGIDVDNYQDKTGATSLLEAEAKWGKLPATWRTTSRDDGVSGIRLYRIPPGLHWPGQVGPSIETIRHAHRYAIAWPSVHPNGGTYRWINPHGTVTIGDVPTPDDFPLLPSTWVQGLTGGRTAEDRQQADLTDPQTHAWLLERPAGAPCRAVARVIQKRVTDLITPGVSRHETMLETTQRLAHLAAEGHTGTRDALTTVHDTFLAVVTRDGTRSAQDAQDEWDRAITGAIRNAAAPPAGSEDPCTNPLAGLIARAPASPAELVRNATTKKETPWTGEPSSVSSSAIDSAAPSSALPASSATTAIAAEPTSTTADEDDDEAPPPSWRPVDLGPYLDGTWTPDTPLHLIRSDGQALLYPGKVHDFHGESESGKSLVVQAEAATRVQNGDDVLYVDFEDDAGPVTRRMLELGCTPDQLLTHFTYVRPEMSPYALAEAEEWATLLQRQFTLAVLDGVTDALGQFGGATKENDDIAAWHRAVPRMLSRRTGAAVILIDHVVKNTDTRGRFAIGGQAKMAAIDGASYSVEVTEPIGKGMRGTITLRIGKDRPGEIRAQCGAWRASDRTQEAAKVIIDSTTGDGIHVTIDPPATSVGDRDADDGKPFRPTGVMEKLSRLVEASREPLTQNKLYEAYKDDGGKARKETFYTAVNTLVDEGHLSEERGPRGARVLRSANVYRQNTDPASDAYTDPLEGLIAPADRNLSSPSRNDSVTSERAGHDLAPPSPTFPRPSPGQGQQGGALSPADRVGDEVATQTGEGRSSLAGHSHNDVTLSQQPPLHPTGPEWRLDYQLGEYVHRDTGEVWDGGDHA